jgi:16S rRNA processing protein RimM
MPDASNTNSSEQLSPDYLLLGEILRPHGVAGEVRMRILTAYPERLSELETVYLADNTDGTDATEYLLESVRMHQGYALMKFEDVGDRDEADRLRQLYVMIAVEDAVPLEEGEFYLYQLIGLEVETEEGQPLGNITEVIETGANDVYVVNGAAYGEVLIPVTEETIVKTDIDAGKIVVKLPEGLLPNN